MFNLVTAGIALGIDPVLIHQAAQDEEFIFNCEDDWPEEELDF